METNPEALPKAGHPKIKTELSSSFSRVCCYLSDFGQIKWRYDQM
jgi:hypothetical protein